MTLLRNTFSAGFLIILTSFGQSPNWEAKSQQAKQAMTSRKFSEAVSLYRELARAFPDNPGLVMNLGLALHSAGEYPEAIRHFQTVVKIQPQMAAAWYLLGVDLQKLNRPAEAVGPLQRAVKMEPNNEAAHLELADALFQTDRSAEAAAEFHSLAVANPKNPKVWLGLGLTYAALGGQAFENLQKSFPDSAYLHMLLGKSQADQNQYRSAYHHYRKAVNLDPSLREAHPAIASIYRATGHPDWAEVEDEAARRLPQPECAEATLPCLFIAKRFEELLPAAKNGKMAESYYWLAKAYEELALQAHARLAALPPSAEMHQLMAAIYDMRELYPEAVQEWRSALAVQPNDRILNKRLAQSLWAAGEWKLAYETALKILAVEPDAGDLRFLAGDSLLKMQLPAEALLYLTKVIALQPRNSRAHSSLASAYVRLGRFRDAIPHLETALPLDRDGALRYQLVQAYQNAGETKKAAILLEEYKKIRSSNDERSAALKLDNEITAPAK